MTNLPDRSTSPGALERIELRAERDGWVRKRRLHQVGVAAADGWLWWSYAQGGGGLILSLALLLLVGLFGLEWLRWEGSKRYDRRIQALSSGNDEP